MVLSDVKVSKYDSEHDKLRLSLHWSKADNFCRWEGKYEERLNQRLESLEGCKARPSSVTDRGLDHFWGKRMGLQQQPRWNSCTSSMSKYMSMKTRELAYFSWRPSVASRMRSSGIDWGGHIEHSLKAICHPQWVEVCRARTTFGRKGWVFSGDLDEIIHKFNVKVSEHEDSRISLLQLAAKHRQQDEE